MNIILLEDVKTLGKRGDIVKVSDGYARNVIIPKKLGLEATPKNLNDLKLQKAREDKLAAQRLAEAKELAESLTSKQIQLAMKKGENGKVFGSISAKEIAEAAKEQFGLDLDKKKIQLGDPIKSFGTFEVPIRLHTEVLGKLYVIVKEK